jgi:hypothetical protein
MLGRYWKARVGCSVRPYPVIIIHMGAHTGAVWIATPDGKPGWASEFHQRGWQVSVVDWSTVDAPQQCARRRNQLLGLALEIEYRRRALSSGFDSYL